MKNCQEVRGGQLYIIGEDGSQKKVATILEATIQLEADNLPREAQEKRRRAVGSITGKQRNFEFSMENVEISYRTRLSLLYGFKVTNNWLKMHGGIMERKGGNRKHRRKPRQ